MGLFDGPPMAGTAFGHPVRDVQKADMIYERHKQECTVCKPMQPCRVGWYVLGYDPKDYDRRFPGG